jgi:hypothetical protein
MPHLLMAKYTPAARAQTHARTAIPLLIVSILITLIQQMVGIRGGSEAGVTGP